MSNGGETFAEVLQNGTIQEIVNESLCTIKTVFVLSHLNKSDLTMIRDHLLTQWNQEHTQQKDHVVSGLIVKVQPLPWAESPALTFYNSFLESMGLPGLQSCVRDAIGFSHPLVFSNLTDNTLLQTVFAALNDYFFLDKIQGIDNPSNILMAYLTDSCETRERRKLGFARNLTMQDRYALLRGIWKCEQGLASPQSLTSHTRICVFVSELENILTYTQKDRRDLLKGLIYLIASLGTLMTFWLNIEGDMVEQVKEACGEAFWTYLTYDLTNQSRSKQDK